MVRKKICGVVIDVMDAVNVVCLVVFIVCGEGEEICRVVMYVVYLYCGRETNMWSMYMFCIDAVNLEDIVDVVDMADDKGILWYIKGYIVIFTGVYEYFASCRKNCCG